MIKIVIPKKKIVTFLFFLTLSLTKLQSFANSDQALVKKIEVKQDSIQVTTSKEIETRSFILDNPDRLVIDISNSKMLSNNIVTDATNAFQKIRHSSDGSNLRIVFESSSKLKITKQSQEKGPDSSIFKKIINYKKTPNLAKSNNLNDFLNQKIAEFDTDIKTSNQSMVQKEPANALSSKKYKPIIIIDAGHGGKDPGAIGRYYRTKEKDLTLSYAKELKKQLLKTNNYEVYMTRETNIFIPLRKRVEFARKKKGDLFLSLHVNSSNKKNISGFSIYTLSDKSSDKEAEMLAKKENRADIINGINFSGASSDIVKTLIDMAQRNSKNHSVKFAEKSIKTIKKYNINSLQNTHRFAGFAVLTAPDMTSVLIELGYITNQDEEKLLNNLFYKRKLSKALVETINDYFQNIK